MRLQTMQCSMCGLRFDPDQHLACQSCPVHSGCDLVCCPNCGYQTVNPRRSNLVRLIRFFSGLRSSNKFDLDRTKGMSLADVPPGCSAMVVGFSAGFPANRRAHLQAYGLVANYRVRVVQHSPVTIVSLDHLELALENELASGIMVQFSPNDQ